MQYYEKPQAATLANDVTFPDRVYQKGTIINIVAIAMPAADNDDEEHTYLGQSEQETKPFKLRGGDFTFNVG